jgi:hypothetical protein
MKAQPKHRMTAAVIGVVAAIASVAVPADAQRIYVTLPLPPAVIVAQVPVYFEGRPVYWYQSRWYYRDPRGAWTYYRAEPPYLHTHRMQHPTRWHYYAGGPPSHHGGGHRR